MPEKFYDVRLKDGRLRRRIHDSKTGKIIGWEDAPYFEEEREEGQFLITEYILHYVPTRDERPSSARNWEFRIRAPRGYSKREIEEMARNIGIDYFNEEMMDTSTINWTKFGEDDIGFSDEEKIEYMIIDNARPQYRYPRNRLWGDYGTDEL